MSDQTQQASVDWERLALTSHYDTAVAIRDALEEGNMAEATHGLEELIDALSRSDRRALESHLIRLFKHLIKWEVQPERRSRSWRNSIINARTEIARIQRRVVSLNRAVIVADWDELTELARREAEGETDLDIEPRTLTWLEVFEADYQLEV
jgi:hypothetical protein